MNLFESNYDKIKPLALRLRPTNLDDFIGQEKILGKGGVLRKLIEKQSISNSIFFGPPGCGKSSLGEIISKTLDSNFETLNATVASLNDLREIVEKAKKNLEFYGKKTILFLDEIHRFNKLQQDALLSYCESGILTLIGATTENPYYSLNNALLSRVMIFEFKSLSRDNIREILEKGVKYIGLEEKISKEVIECILDISQGDSRIAINYLELYQNSCMDLEDEEVLDIFRQRQSSYHKAEDKYNLISALIKSMRGSDPDAALYWLGRLLHGGEDPRYIARRIMIHASEDVGMANPEAMLIASSAMAASEKIGMPEVKIILAQAVIYLSISTKSNSCYMGINKAMEDIEKGDMETVPLTICHNAKGYKYPHDYAGNFVKQNYTAKKREYYVPGDNKNEKLIKEKMEKLWGK
ncbi:MULTISPECIES: replication-associated recombination protein A [Fusobacterium]|jgi:putative ATPase|uniref:replication-associated recombination protein A n=1 Tax=Fusobacterium TaxID=848 RepID=UPI000E52A16A|nr:MULTISPECIES: replication-associated recombination protein A [Fusobacterium]MCB8564628.1 replication-associated recombination protein A [Fusobacterium ulcerans]MCB8649073.1 replication-associated recombination protein A [Fusobacterium ulcerans]MDH6457157.1 putative ATPase [Fusobacterium sp. PH5-7]MEE0138074.1 replication-associated recombination protein A [Fusobacterium ulcerans]RGY65093.1 replication-associated recombination protein A [Fusobacterium ulcerans]